MSGTPGPQKKLWVYFHLGLLYSGREPRTKDRDMGFFSDLAMGLGMKPKTQDYVNRTADTIARTDPARAASYKKKESAKLGKSSSKKSSGRSSAAVQSSLTFADEVLKDPSRFLPPSVDTSSIKITPEEQKKFNEQFRKANTYTDVKTGQRRTGRGEPTGVTYTPGAPMASTATDEQRKKDLEDLQRNLAIYYKDENRNLDNLKNPTGQFYQIYGRSVNLEKDPTLLQQGIGGGLTGSLANYASGSRPLDPIVNIIDGKPIYQDSQGRTYAYDNLFGMRYDTVSDQSLDVLPRDMPQGSDDDDDRPAATEVVEEKAPDDPCPEGYRMNPETKQCELDPFKQPFADAVTTPPAPVMTSNLSPYTQMAPVTLGQLQPTRVAAANPLAMQQANMPPAGGLGSLAPVLNRTS